MTLGRHLLDLAGGVTILVGPLPLSLALVRTDATAPDPRAERLLGVLTLWCLVQMGVALMLCALGRYALGPVLGVETALFAAGLLARRPVETASPVPRTPVEGLALGMLAVVGVGLFLRLVLTPITDFDSLAYHLPAMARWYQAHTFVRLEQFKQISRYPYAWEMLSGLFLMPFREDFLVALPGLVAWVMLALATDVAALELGAQRPAALAAAVLVVATPVARRIVTTMHVDLPLAACFMAGLAFATAARRAPGARTVGLTAAAAGLVAGIKMSGLVYDALLAVVLALAATRARRAARPTETADRALCVLGVAGALVVGGVWYLINWMELGNPLGHLRVELAGTTIFPGSVDSHRVARTTLAALFHPTSRADWRVLLSALTAQGALPLLILGLGACGLRPRRPHLAVAALLVATGFLYWTTPYGGDNDPRHTILTPWMGQAVRYALPFVGVLGVGAALGAGALGQRAAAASAVGIALVLPGTTHTLTPLAIALLAALAGGVTLARRGPRARVLVGVALLVVVAGGTSVLRARRAVERAKRYGGVPEFVSAHVGPAEAVGYLLGQRSYLLYGPDYGTRVVYVPAGPGGREAWLATLRRERVAIVAVGPRTVPLRAEPEMAWLTDPQGPFTHVFGRDPAREPLLFRLRPES